MRSLSSKSIWKKYNEHLKKSVNRRCTLILTTLTDRKLSRRVHNTLLLSVKAITYWATQSTNNHVGSVQTNFYSLVLSFFLLNVKLLLAKINCSFANSCTVTVSILSFVNQLLMPLGPATVVITFQVLQWLLCVWETFTHNAKNFFDSKIDCLFGNRNYSNKSFSSPYLPLSITHIHSDSGIPLVSTHLKRDRTTASRKS